MSKKELILRLELYLAKLKAEFEEYNHPDNHDQLTMLRGEIGAIKLALRLAKKMGK